LNCVRIPICGAEKNINLLAFDKCKDVREEEEMYYYKYKSKK